MPSYKSDLQKRTNMAQSWMFDAALPFWAARARHDTLGFLEALDLDGRAIDAPTSRVRVQARQTYCFALAKSLGWQPETAAALCAYGLEILTTHCRREDGLYGRDFSHAGGMADTTAELYDSAFARLAFATAHAAGISQAKPHLDAVITAIETHLKRPGSASGYAETLPAPTDRNQNPHMHLYESSLAHFSATAEPVWMHQAHGLEALMETRFLRPDGGGLRERFAADWSAHPDDHFEAGHQYEWVWLLHTRAGLDGRKVHAKAADLYAKALDLTGPENEVWLKQDLGGDILDGTQRSWGLTEAVKAHIVMFEAGETAAAKRCVESFDRLWNLHIAPAIEGGWIDAYDQANNPTSQDIPASIGYHVFLAIAELMRVTARF